MTKRITGSADGVEDQLGRARRLRAGTAIGLLFACGLTPALPAHAGDATLPSGGSVTAGAAAISADGAHLTVDQSSRTAIVSWQSFSVGGSASAHFANGSGATLNRVGGNVPSTIDGSLTATGSVYLVNPAGVAVGTGGHVATGGSFVGTTQDVTDQDFLDGGAMTFSGISRASAVNAGTISSAQGDVALIARRVENSGTIKAPNGSAALAAGYTVRMRDKAGADGRFSVEVGGGDTEAVNTGTIRAAQAEMRANGGNVYALAGNTDAVVKATGVKTSGGRVFLTAGSGGKVKATQRVIARRRVAHPAPHLPTRVPVPTPRPQNGGDITITGGDVELGGTIDASGTNGGAGGTVTALADGSMNVTGGVRATGSEGAEGGFIETSGGQFSVAGDARIDAGTGDWLIDPYDLTVDAAAATTINASLGGGTGVTLQTTDTGASGPGTPDVSGRGDIVIDSPLAWGTAAKLTLDAWRSIAVNASISANGSGGGVVLHTNIGGGGGAYAVNAPINLNAGSTFTTQDGSASPVNYTIVTALGAEGSATGGDLQGIGADLNGNYVLGADIDASATAGWNGGDGFAPIGDMISQFTGTFDGLGHTISDLAINRDGTNSVGLFGYATGDIGNIDLRDASVRGDGYVGALAGFSSGAIANVGATGTVAGSSNVGGLVGTKYGGRIETAYADSTVTAFDTASGSNAIGGLVGYQDGGTIAGSSATGTVTGTDNSENVGGLAGYVQDAAVTDSSANLAASGFSGVGGLIGTQYGGSVNGSHAAGDVSGGTGSFNLGGLVGNLTGNGNVENSYATGDVTGGSALGGLVGNFGSASINLTYAAGKVEGIGSAYDIGGLVGYQGTGSAINASFATGDASGAILVGGLVGRQVGGSTRQTYATGDVSAGDNAYSLGGLVGEQTGGSVEQAYASGTVSGGGGSVNVGGLVGYQRNATITDAYATGAVTAGSQAGGLIGVQVDGTVVHAYAAGLVSGQEGVLLGGLIGASAGTNTLTGTFWDTEKTGQSDSAGGTGLTTAQLQDTAGFMALAGNAGWDFKGVWAPPSDGHYPEFYALSRVARVDLDDMGTITYGDASPYATVDARYGGPGDYVFAPAGDSLHSPALTQPADGLDVGDYTVAGPTSGLSAKGDTYRFVYTNDGFSIDPAPLTVTADAGQSKTYGDSDPTLTYDASGFRAGDTVSVLTGELSRPAGENVGSYAIGQNNLDAGGNYTITYTGADFAITPRALTVTADDKGRVYGDANPALTWTVGGMGLVNGDTIDGALATAADKSSDVGTYAIGQGTLDASSNYALTFNPGTLTIDPAHIAVTANGGSSVYGDDPADPGLSANGLKNGEDVSVLTGLSSSFGIDGETDAGGYTLSVDGALTNGNYAIDARNAGTWTVARRALTVTADDKGRVYGDANPALTWTVGGMGLVNGDTIDGALATAADKGSDVGTYAIGQGTLDASSNYDMAFIAGALKITPRAIAVTADDQHRDYGDANPELTWSVGGMGLADGDTLDGALATAADARSDAGSYAIGQGTLGASSNYDMTFTAGALTVTPRALTVTADDMTKLFGAPVPGLTASIASGSLAPFDASLADALDGFSLATGARQTSPAGTYAIAVSGANANYALTLQNGTLTVTDKLPPSDDALERWPKAGFQPARTERRSDGGAQDTVCTSGVLGPDCARLPWPANRTYGPWLSATAN